MTFSINSHVGEGKKRGAKLSFEDTRENAEEEGEKKSGAETLESCDRESLPSSFLLLVLCFVQ